jgi:diaminohydroxyphosphoribosylaminopyrimidine deaminase / 5-amino-6-(5-phosphoribosylamino)uracil reductase
LTACTAADRAHLARAVALAETVRARTAPNPGVGCVLVRDGCIVGEGATTPAGGPHAEAVALGVAGARAQGATAYVTLEPCAHHGRTPPCTDALVDAGVRRVVHAVADPNPPAAGGAAVLRGHGVEVVGPGEVGTSFRGTVAAQLEGFLRSVRSGRPHLTLKLAQTADGRLVAPDGARWITGPAARAAVHRWRSASDLVLVGVGTVLADDPRLDVRTDPAPPRQPRPVVLDTHLRTPVTAAVVTRGALLLCGESPDPRRSAALSAAGAEVVEVARGPDGRLDPAAALAALAPTATAVFAEPGGTLAATLLGAGLVDRLVLHVNPALGDGPPRHAVPIPAGWRLERAGGAGPDLLLHLVPTEAP